MALVRVRLGGTGTAITAIAVLLAGTAACSSPPAEADASSWPATSMPTPSTPTGRILTVGQDGAAMYSSLQRAADATKPGDTVVIDGGTYEETLVVPNDGVDGKPITYRAADGEKVVVGGRGRVAKEDALVTLTGRSFVTLVGITVTDSASHGILAEGARHVELRDSTIADSSNGGVVFIDGSDITITGCEVRGNNARGTDATHEAVSLQNVERFAVVNSVVHNNGEEGIDAKYGSRKGTIRGNQVFANRGPNIYIDSASDVEVAGNLVYRTTAESKPGIGLAVEDWAADPVTSGVRVENNVVYGNSGGGIGFWIESRGSFADIKVVNNTIYGNADAGIDIAAAGAFTGTNLLRNNVFSDNAQTVSGSLTGFAADTNLVDDDVPPDLQAVEGSAEFVDPAAADLRLLPDSPGIDAGNPDQAPVTDFQGEPRPLGDRVDVGAFEHDPADDRPIGQRILDAVTGLFG